MSKPSILMIVENSYPGDPRVRKEATTLKEFYDITVVALGRKTEKFHETVDGVEVFRLPRISFSGFNTTNQFVRKVSSKAGYIMQYVYITVLGAFLFLGTHLKRRYRVIHVHNPPDTLFLIGLIAKLLSIKFVFDHHDLCPELYLVRFSRRPDIVHTILMWCERFSCRLANVIISTNESYKRLVIERHGVPPDKIYIVRNDPVLEEFSEAHQPNQGGLSKEKDKKIFLFLGSINPQDGLDLLLKSIHYLVNDLNERGFVCWIIGDGDSLESTKRMANELNLTEYVDFKGIIFDRAKLRQYLSLADVCVEPAPDNELNRRSTFIKVMEYMASGKAHVAFDLAETRVSSSGSGVLVPPNDTVEFAGAMKLLLDKAQLRKDLGQKGMDRISTDLNWEKAARKLVDAYKFLAV
jgi:glycosyltransferase involved in cell wall biosynthesis